MMKQATVASGKGIETIAIGEAAIPEPGPGEALIRIKAATLNFRDTIVAKGLIPGLGKEPEVVPLSCCAAEVVGIGDGVTRVATGDRVVPLFAPFWLARSTASRASTPCSMRRAFAPCPTSSAISKAQRSPAPR